MKHGAKFAFAEYLANVFMFVGKLGLTAFNVFLAYLFMKNVTGTANEVSNPYGPLVFVAIFSYMIVAVFLGLFDETVIAFMTSFTADLDLNEGN